MFIFFTILLIAVGLSLDTFSLSLSYGMLNMSKKEIFRISIVVGISHFIMPLLGYLFGELILNIIKIDEELLIGIIFLIISFDLLISLFKNEEVKPIKNTFELLIFAISVSFDSFSTGICLDIFIMPKILISLIFMIVSFVFTFLGLTLGYKLHDKIGRKAEIIGVILLFCLSLIYIFLT